MWRRAHSINRGRALRAHHAVARRPFVSGLRRAARRRHVPRVCVRELCVPLDLAAVRRTPEVAPARIAAGAGRAASVPRGEAPVRPLVRGFRAGPAAGAAAHARQRSRAVLRLRRAGGTAQRPARARPLEHRFGKRAASIQFDAGDREGIRRRAARSPERPSGEPSGTSGGRRRWCWLLRVDAAARRRARSRRGGPSGPGRSGT